jgi:hypothetical protein
MSNNIHEGLRLSDQTSNTEEAEGPGYNVERQADSFGKSDEELAAMNARDRAIAEALANSGTDRASLEEAARGQG